MKYLLHGKVEINVLQWLEDGAIVHFAEKHVCIHPFFTDLNSIVLQPELDQPKGNVSQSNLYGHSTTLDQDKT